MLAFGLMIVAACGGEVVIEDYIANEEAEKEYEEAELTQQELFIQDLDYMLYVLENNFALFDVAYWAHGADIPEIINDMRTVVMENPDMDLDEFYDALVLNFDRLFGVGHFSIVTPANHRDIVSNTSSYSKDALARFSYRNVLSFYEPRYPDVSLSPLERAANTIRLFGESRIQRLVSLTLFMGEAELSGKIEQAFANGDFEEAANLTALGEEIYDSTPIVVTDIIEEGSIAYLALNSFMPNRFTYGDQVQILKFFDEVRDFEHLILDIRMNTGGHETIFFENIMGPNISEEFRLKSYAFMVPGYYFEEFLINVSPNTRIDWVIPTEEQRRTVPDMLENFDFIELNFSDMERMEYGFVPQDIVILPMNQNHFGNVPAFSGKIWLLTGPLVTSAAQVSAWAAKESGFATLVGEVTGGVFGGPRTYVALPNTGVLFRFDLFYITDERGRPLEAGTVPHHFNRDGMDALETTLALIADGEYHSGSSTK